MANYQFFTGIPAAGNNPSSDQPNMQTNNANLNALIGVDHVNFNTNNGGTHLQVTFSSNNVPGGYTLPVLYTNNDANSHPQLFLATTSATNSTNQYTAASSGSALLMGGMILKWFSGTVTPPFTAFTYAGLGLANFPNNAWQAFLGKADTTHNIGFTSLGTSGVTITSSGSGSFTASVLIVGN